MKLHVLIGSSSGTARPGDEMALHAAVHLLRRWTGGEIAGVSLDPEVSAAAHPGMRFVPESALDEALQDAVLFAIAGDLRGGALERAARQLCAAKLAGVPAALVAVRTAAGEHGARAGALLREVLSQVESVSACDANSAGELAAARGRRVEVASPLEMLLEFDAAPGKEAGCVGVDGELLAASGEAERQALEDAARSAGLRTVVLPERLGGRAPGAAAAAAVDARAWAERVARCEIVVAGCASPALALALAAGRTPVALLQGDDRRSALHERLGLQDLARPFVPDAPALAALLEAARDVDPAALRVRSTPLRRLGWRALAPLSEAGRSRPLAVQGWSGAGLAVLAAACAARAAGALAAGDAVRAERLLEPWREALATQPRWAQARARAWALLGQDEAASAGLEQALAAHPDDAGCRAELARARVRCGDLAGAAQAWTLVARSQPASAEPWYELGCLELLRGSPAGALTHWAETQKRQPGHAASARSVRLCLDADPATEIGFWEGLCRERPEAAALWVRLGDAAVRAGAQDLAATCLSHAIALAPEEREHWETLRLQIDPQPTRPAEAPATAAADAPAATPS